MVSKSRWKLLAMLALVLVVMVLYSISREDRYIELFYFPIPEKKEPCLQGEAERKASKLFGNYSRDQPIFLQLKDYFWVKTPSAYELPYGTKGSEDLLLRVLAITTPLSPRTSRASGAAAAWSWGTGTGYGTAHWEMPSTSTMWSSD